MWVEELKYQVISIAQHSIAQHIIAQHSIAQHSIAQHSVAWHSIARHGMAWHGVNTEISEFNLQSDLARIADWLLVNKPSINVGKCKLLLVSTLQHRAQQRDLHVLINEVPLESVECQKYLGFWIDQNLSFNIQIRKTIFTINKRLGNIRQATTFLDCKYSLLFKKLVIPFFDYSDTLYHSCLTGEPTSVTDYSV